MLSIFLTCLLLWITSFPSFALCFHDLSYAILSLFVQMCFTWKFFLCVGTLEDFSLEDFFPSFSFILLSSISSTSLVIPLILHLTWHWDYMMWSCLGVWSLFLSKWHCIFFVYIYWSLKIIKKHDVFQKSKKMIYC